MTICTKSIKNKMSKNKYKRCTSAKYKTSKTIEKNKILK